VSAEVCQICREPMLYEGERTLDLGAIRNHLGDLLETHPMQEWSTALLLVVTGAIEASMTVHGINAAPIQIGKPVPTLRVVK
jgi:hypothetical protein